MKKVFDHSVWIPPDPFMHVYTAVDIEHKFVLM